MTNAEIYQLLWRLKSKFVASSNTHCELFLDGSGSTHFATMNMNHLVLLRRGEVSPNYFLQCDRIIIDGAGVERLLRKKLNLSVDRWPGPDFFHECLLMARRKNIVVGVIGSSLDVVKGLVDSYGEFCVEHVQLPFRSSDDQFNVEEIAHEMRSKSVDSWFISLGAPKQERLHYRLIREGTDCSNVIPVGAAIDFLSETSGILRSPRWMSLLGVEWSWRLLFQFKKTGPRLCR